jgi:hypothetical protein
MPRKHCTTRVRSRGHVVRKVETQMVKFFRYMQDPKATWQDWSFLTITLKKAEQMESDGDVAKVTRLVDGEVQVVGYRSLKPNILERPTPCTLTFATMKAVGKRAAGQELRRHERREVEKFIAWPFIGDTRAVAVRPRVSEADRKLAENVFRTGYLKDLPKAA